MVGKAQAEQLVQTLLNGGVLKKQAGFITVERWLLEALFRADAADLLVSSQKRSILVGITGNIGTGKSTVLHMAHTLGALVIDADQLVHALREPGQPGYDALLKRFGKSILQADGTINRGELADRAFRDQAVLKELEAIFRPLVVRAVEQKVAAAEESIVVVEAIKLLEGGLRDTIDQIWVVNASRETQLARLMHTRGLSEAQASSRIDAQNPQAAKLAQADIIIENNGDLNNTRYQVAQAWKPLLKTLYDHARMNNKLLEDWLRFVLAINGFQFSSALLVLQILEQANDGRLSKQELLTMLAPATGDS